MKESASPPALRIKVRLRQDQHTLPLLPVQVVTAGVMAGDDVWACRRLPSQLAQSRREVCCLVVPMPGLELNGKGLGSSPRGADSPPGMSVLEVHLFSSPNLLKKQGSMII